MNFLQKIATATVVMALMVTSSANIASAQLSSLFVKSFGGPILTIVPPTPICPVAHTVIFDFASKMPVGIATVAGSRIYLYGNLITPGVMVLGSGLPTPIPCPYPYKIYPILQVGTALY